MSPFLILPFMTRLDGFLAVLEEDAEHEKRRVDVFEIFEPRSYVKFRQQPLLKSAIEFARDGKIGAVSSLLHKYPAELNRVKLTSLFLNFLLSTSDSTCQRLELLVGSFTDRFFDIKLQPFLFSD